MTTPAVRIARLEDTAAIVEIFTHGRKWYKNAAYGKATGHLEEVPYRTLSIAERMHNHYGRGFVSVETMAIHLNNLLLHQVPAVVYEKHGRVIAYMELYIGRECAPLHLNAFLGALAVHPDMQARGIGTAMLTAAEGLAVEYACDVITVRPDPHETLAPFYQKCGYSLFMDLSKVTFATRPIDGLAYEVEPLDGIAFSELEDQDLMLGGRQDSSMYHWMNTRQQMALPELGTIVMDMLVFQRHARKAIVLCINNLEDQSEPSYITLWTKRDFTPTALLWVQDYLYRQGYPRACTTAVKEHIRRLLPHEVSHGETYQLWGKSIEPTP